MGCLTLFLAFYIFKIGLGSLIWVVRYNQAKDRDFKTLWRQQKDEDDSVKEWDHVTHFVIMAAYKEKEEDLMLVLRTLITQLPDRDSHERDFCKKHIIVVLALEAREGQDALDKFARLKAQVGGHFKAFEKTAHPPNLTNDIPGRAVGDVTVQTKILGLHASKRGRKCSMQTSWSC